MTNAISKIEALARQRSAPSPLSKAEVINELSACLALVRPSGMSDQAAEEWLTVAANDVLGFAEQRPTMFKELCTKARGDCTHHGQIIPFILKRSRFEWERQGEPFLTREQIALNKGMRLEISSPRGGVKRIGEIKTLPESHVD